MARQITLDQAEAIVAACKQEALAVGQPMNIAVVDDGSHLVAFAAMDDTKLIGNDIAQKKALTAVYFQMDTRDLVPLVQPGAELYGIEATSGGRLVVFAGGVLLRVQIADLLNVDQEWAAASVPVTAVMWLAVSMQRGVLQGLRAYRPVGLSIVGEGGSRLVLGVHGVDRRHAGLLLHDARARCARQSDQDD